MPVSFRGIAFAALLLASTGISTAQTSTPATQTPNPAAPTPHNHGFSIYESLEGSPSTGAQTYELDNTARYRLGDTFNVVVGVPFFFTRGQTTSSTGQTSTTSASGLGDAFVTLNWRPVNGFIAWTTGLTGYAPTGNTNLGLSTGRGLFTWNNHFAHPAPLVTPYADIGIGNTTTDPKFFVRPFKTLGASGNFDAGATINLLDWLDFDAYGYANLAAGTQKIYSRLVHAGQAAGASGNAANGFRNSHLTTGGASAAEDNGFSGVFEVSPRSYLDLSIGFTRSTRLNINSATFGIGVNVTKMLGWTR